tara:strand:+ start:40 stop:303 length:264 start_codon:yes stop_codon:yes gene_type:complete
MSEIEMRKITYNPLLNMKYDIPLQKKYSPKLNLFNEIVWVQERVPHQSYTIPNKNSSINEYDFFKSLNYNITFKNYVKLNRCSIRSE